MGFDTIFDSVKQEVIYQGDYPFANKLKEFMQESIKGREKVGFYPSELALPGYCIRKEVYRRILGNRIEKPGIFLQKEFDVGTAAHSWFQNHYLGPAGFLKGKWICSRCLSVVEGYMPKNPCKCGWKSSIRNDEIKNCAEICSYPDGFEGKERDCRTCRYPLGHWTYLEPRIVYSLDGSDEKRFQISGYADGILTFSEDKLLEMKTISEKQYEELTKPKKDHIYQVNILLGCSNRKSAVIVYISKQDYGTKEFYVEFDQEIFNECINKAKTVVEFVKAKKIPGEEYRHCKKISSSKRCPFAEECYGAELKECIEKQTEL